MFELKGKYGLAKVYSDNKQESAIDQIIELLNQKWTKDIEIAIMPDYHAGIGCVIGTTMKIKDKIVPNLVGVDIGCGMHVVNIGDIDLNLELLDIYIRGNIPSGFNINSDLMPFGELNSLKCINHIKLERPLKSIGTLGGGNHFIEIDIAENNDKYLVIHSGSRNLGKQVADFYQNLAYKNCNKREELIKKTIEKLKEQNKHSKIESAIKGIKETTPIIEKSLAYLEGDDFNNYIHDIKIVQKFSSKNREVMANKILKYFEIEPKERFETIHNYIDVENMILRKGAISAKQDEKVIIPINMRDGCIIGKGLGNNEWNQSAPHGAGRIMGRKEAKEKIELKDFVKSMRDVYSTSVNSSTLDESPMVYKPIGEIINNTKDSIEILEIIKPIYNFKA